MTRYNGVKVTSWAFGPLPSQLAGIRFFGHTCKSNHSFSRWRGASETETYQPPSDPQMSLNEPVTSESDCHFQNSRWRSFYRPPTGPSASHFAYVQMDIILMLDLGSCGPIRLWPQYSNLGLTIFYRAEMPVTEGPTSIGFISHTLPLHISQEHSHLFTRAWLSEIAVAG